MLKNKIRKQQSPKLYIERFYSDFRKIVSYVKKFLLNTLPSFLFDISQGGHKICLVPGARQPRNRSAAEKSLKCRTKNRFKPTATRVTLETRRGNSLRDSTHRLAPKGTAQLGQPYPERNGPRPFFRYPRPLPLAAGSHLLPSHPALAFIPNFCRYTAT